MTKIKFLLSLHEKLSTLPQDEVEERLNFYSEMIEDRMEEGLSEEDAVSAVGSVDEIAAQIAADIPQTKPEQEKAKPTRQLKAWEIALLWLGSPIWLSLLIAAFAVAISACAVLLSLIVTLWAVFAAFLACGFGGILAGAGFAVVGFVYPGIALIAAGFICIGISILLCLGCKAATKGITTLAKQLGMWIKNRFIKKEGAK